MVLYSGRSGHRTPARYDSRYGTSLCSSTDQWWESGKGCPGEHSTCK